MNDATISNIPTNIAASTIPASPAAAIPTPGWKTTEFWMTALGQLGLAVASVSGNFPAKYAVIAGAVGQAAYNVSRGLAKSKATPVPTIIALPTPAAA